MLRAVMVPLTFGMSSPGRKMLDNPSNEKKPEYYVLETLTIYHPEKGQCDADPLITANNSRIDLEKLRRNETPLCH